MFRDSIMVNRCMWCVQWTNVSKDFKGTLDYIFYTHESLAPSRCWSCPRTLRCRRPKLRAAQRALVPPDHIALMAEFAYRQQR